MGQVADLLLLPAVQRSFLALVLAGASLPIVGVFIVGLDIVTMRVAVMHLALLGMAIGFLLHLDPLLCALAICGVSGASLAPFARSSRGLAGPMSLLMTFGIALALLVLSISGVNATGAFALLWGSILATKVVDLVVLGVVAALVLTLYWLRRHELALLLFDRELALCSGVNADRLVLILLFVIAVAVASSIRLTGALLVDALTLLPAIGARNLGRSLGSMVAWSVVLGLTGSLAGFVVSLVVDQPPGPVLVLVAGAITLSTYSLRGVLHAVSPFHQHDPRALDERGVVPGGLRLRGVGPIPDDGADGSQGGRGDELGGGIREGRRSDDG